MTDPISSLGYTETETQFLRLVMGLGGYFVRRQFNQFVDCQTGKRTTDFIQKLLSRGHARLTVNRHGRQVLHLHFKPLYSAIDDVTNRNRRPHQPRAIIARLMTLDFALAHPDWQILASESAKSAHFRAMFGIETTRLERLLLCLSYSKSSRPQFCYIDEGLATLSAFENCLRRAMPVFESVGPFTLIFAAAQPHLFTKTEAAFRRIVLGAGGRNRAIDVNRLLRHFADRQLFETRQTRGFDKRRLDQLREDRDEFSAPLHEALYHLWRDSGDDAVKSRLRKPPASPRQLAATFRTHLLEHDYAIFDTVRAAS